MNILLWIFQILLALLIGPGGGAKAFMLKKLPKFPSTKALPNGVWIFLGILEMTCALGLLLPAKIAPHVLLSAACILTVENLCLVGLHTRYAKPPRFTAKLFSMQYPLIWCLVIAVVAGFIAYGRFITPA